MLGSGSGVIKREPEVTLVMRANHAGDLDDPRGAWSLRRGTYKTEPVQITVEEGAPRRPERPAAPAAAFERSSTRSRTSPSRTSTDDLDQEAGPEIPISRARTRTSSCAPRWTGTSLYVGEQVTLTLYIFSRVDLSSVDTVTMPKLDGFWSEDVDSPSQLSAEQRIIGGVPYRAYLLRRRALFPVKPGSSEVGAAEADITTGFLFAGRRVHRKGNELTIRVKPLPTASARPISLPATSASGASRSSRGRRRWSSDSRSR